MSEAVSLSRASWNRDRPPSNAVIRRTPKKAKLSLAPTDRRSSMRNALQLKSRAEAARACRLHPLPYVYDMEHDELEPGFVRIQRELWYEITYTDNNLLM